MLTIKKFWDGFDKISRVSQIIIKAGSCIALCFLLGGMAYYQHIVNFSPTYYTEFLMATEIVKTSVMVFTEALLGAVLFDYIASRRK